MSYEFHLWLSSRAGPIPRPHSRLLHLAWPRAPCRSVGSFFRERAVSGQTAADYGHDRDSGDAQVGDVSATGPARDCCVRLLSAGVCQGLERFGVTGVAVSGRDHIVAPKPGVVPGAPDAYQAGARPFSCRAPPRRDDDGAAEGTRLRRAQQIDMVRDIARRKRTVSAFFQEGALNQTSGAV